MSLHTLLAAWTAANPFSTLIILHQSISPSRSRVSDARGKNTICMTLKKTKDLEPTSNTCFPFADANRYFLFLLWILF
jgi:hypothetical protein